MSTAARKLRKRSGAPFSKPQKTPTPLEDRAIPVVQKREHGVLVNGYSNRAKNRIERYKDVLFGKDRQPLKPELD